MLIPPPLKKFGLRVIALLSRPFTFQVEQIQCDCMLATQKSHEVRSREKWLPVDDLQFGLQRVYRAGHEFKRSSAGPQISQS